MPDFVPVEHDPFSYSGALGPFVQPVLHGRADYQNNSLLAQDAREAAAKSMSAFSQRNRLPPVDPRWAMSLPNESNNVEDRRHSDTFAQALALMPLQDLIAMTQHPMTTWRDVQHLVYPQDASLYQTQLADDAGTGRAGVLPPAVASEIHSRMVPVDHDPFAQ